MKLLSFGEHDANDSPRHSLKHATDIRESEDLSDTFLTVMSNLFEFLNFLSLNIARSYGNLLLSMSCPPLIT